MSSKTPYLNQFAAQGIPNLNQFNALYGPGSALSKLNGPAHLNSMMGSPPYQLPGILGILANYGKSMNENTNTLQKISMTNIPVAADVAGILGDLEMYRQNPEERTMTNFGLSGLGLLPFVPSAMGSIKNVSKSVADLPKPTKRQIEAYETGKKVKEMYPDEIWHSDYMWDDIFRNKKVPEWLLDPAAADATSSMFFRSGFEGTGMPEYVSGWRYGDIPDIGVSYNYRDDFAEDGVSLMEVFGGSKTQDKISSLFLSDGRKKVYVEGWLNPYDVGSDGEPLIRGAVISKK